MLFLQVSPTAVLFVYIYVKNVDKSKICAIFARYNYNNKQIISTIYA